MKKLLQILKKMYTFETNYSVRNSYELIERIHSLQLPTNAKLASLDIVNLYTCVPINETIEIIRQNLIKHKKLSTPEIVELIELLQLVLSQNYFTFNGKIYKQKEGLAMGSPLSGFLADIFINNLENSIIKNYPQAHKIISYSRFVDDTLLIFNGSTDEIKTLYETFNKAHSNIKFTIEYETNKNINFLDMNIATSNNIPAINIYRKPTTTDTTIDNSSTHPNSHKEAAFRALIHRAYKIPLKQKEFDKEINTISLIARNNGYSYKKIHKIHKKVKEKLNKSLNNSQETDNHEKKYVSLPYLGTVSDKLPSFLRKQT